jgi:hypothetical protein
MAPGRDGHPSGTFDDSAAEGGSVELLDTGPDPRFRLLIEPWLVRFDRVPRAARWAATISAALVVMLGYLLLRPAGERLAQLADSATPARQFAVDQTVEMVTATARDTRPLSDYIRSSSAPGACALVPAGARPQQNLVQAVHEALPGYSVRDIARTLDQFTAMCTLQMRARDALGSTLVVTIASPARASSNPFDQVTVTSRSDGSALVSVVSNTTRAGWIVTVGTIGPDSDQPSSAVMLDLAQDPRLRW